MNSAEQVEIALRAAHLAETALGLMKFRDVKLARLHVADIVCRVRDIDGALDRIEGIGVPPEPEGK